MRSASCGLAVVLLVLAVCPGCSEDECLPACAGRECGDDGCGGSCGECHAAPTGPCHTGAGECLAGVCQYPAQPDGTPCPDDVYCDGQEVCRAGQCLDGSPVECDTPGDACLESHCDEATQGCVSRQVSDGTVCEDGDPCTAPDQCQAGACISGQDICLEEVVILMYLAADNDLDEWIMDNWQAMESARVDDFYWLRVFVLVDRSAYFDWSDTRFYELHNGYSQELEGPNLGLSLAGSEELNLGDGATVTAFIRDVKDIVGPQASYYLLLLDHGDGWWKNKHEPPATRGCCYDETSGDDYLAQAELSLAVREEGLALIGFDACLQGMAEVAYEHRADAWVMIGSQELEGGWGWDYATLLSDFGQSSDPSPESFAKLAVDTYLELSLFNHDQTATLAVYDLAGMDDLALAASDMAAALTALSTDDFNTLCAQLEWYGCEGLDCEEYTDLYRLAELAQAVDPSNVAVYQAVMAEVLEVVIYERHGTFHAEARGLNVFYACYYYPYEEYSDNTWAVDTGWGEMVNSH